MILEATQVSRRTWLLKCCCYFNKTMAQSAILVGTDPTAAVLERLTAMRSSLSGDLRLHQNKQQSFAENHLTVTLSPFTSQTLSCRQCFSGPVKMSPKH